MVALAERPTVQAVSPGSGLREVTAGQAIRREPALDTTELIHSLRSTIGGLVGSGALQIIPPPSNTLAASHQVIAGAISAASSEVGLHQRS